ncbi:hypothetical protein J3R30DRAFT_3483441 [Lentinula aciculospora]|uniref:Uncharacterized protein n=1 Tax=Lentinula aciculospora TaxID=153920 RepID=A0A9W9A8X4_9AGAR|nr:hypothetical protein J3R30DRAFT_3483441 [Lentinula aciculospora]
MPPSSDTLHLASSSLPETDSFSDSDWLDIASNRESDTESISSNNGGASSSLSRRSSISIGSSHDGEVEAWEGFIEESADETEASKNNLLRSTDSDNGQLTNPFIDIDDNHVEERRVRDGLDQSLTSTLSASRTSSHPSTVHNSLRDLRLSFPDPLHNSYDELNRSYDKVSSSEAATIALTESGEDEEFGTMPELALMQDPGPPPTPEAPGQDSFQSFQIYSSATVKSSNLQVVLYGTSSNRSFVDELLRKAIVGGELAGIDKSETDQLRPAIFDHTDDCCMPRSDYNPDRPSLAILFHPFVDATIPAHTAYLPVVPFKNDDSFEKEQQEAQITWVSYDIPSHKVIILEGSNSSCMFAAEDVDKLDPYHTHQAIQRAMRQEKPASRAGLFEQFNTVHAVTLFALLCIIAGFSVNTAIGVQPLRGIVILPPSPTISNKSDSNQSTALAVRTTSSISVIPVSLNHAPALHNRGAMSASGAGPSHTAYPLPKAEDRNAGQISHLEGSLATWAERMKLSKEVMTRPLTSLSAQAPADISSSSLEPVASTPATERPSSVVATQLVDSLSGIVFASAKALIEVVEHNLKDLMVAIDELMLALHRSTVTVVQQSKITAQIVWEQLEYRNARAKDRAKELQAKGMQLVSSAGNHLLRRTFNAKQKANFFKDLVVSRRREWKDKLKYRAQRAQHRVRHHKSGIKNRRMDL